MGQLTTIGDADIRLAMQGADNAGKGVRRCRNGILGQVDQHIRCNLLTGPTPRTAMIELARLDHFDPRTGVAQTRHAVVARTAVDHQKLVGLQGLTGERRQQALEVSTSIARGNDQGNGHQLSVSATGTRP